jgi:chromosomal replication initiation ATPase DnaA
LIKTYGIHIYNHWFSKLTPVIDEDAKTIELIVPNSFVQEEVTRRYRDNIKKIVNELGMKFKGISK